MPAPLPKLNKVQAKDIHDELEAVASVFLPEWRGTEIEGEFGQALLKIISRLGEYVTTRIEKTPWRDAVAFFDSLDIPVQAPRPSSAPLVFLLGEQLNSPVFAPSGIQVTADAEEGELPFETLNAVNLTPARLEFIAAVDDESDSIELAPPGFLKLEPQAGPLPTFIAKSFAEKGSKSIQIEPYEGLEKTDQIKIGDFVYRLDEGEDGLFALMDPLEEDVQENSEIQKVVEFEAFNNRDLQEHALHIGHSELLNLEQETEIRLQITPQSYAEILSGELNAWQIWGKKNGDEKPDWQTLESRVAAGSVILSKNVEITTEKTKVSGTESFWIRYVVNGSVHNQLFDIRLSSLEMSVNTPEDNKGEDNGNDTSPNAVPPPGL